MDVINEGEESDQNRSELDSLESLLAWETEPNPECNFLNQMFTDQNVV
jgi:hypothetical protein